MPRIVKVLFARHESRLKEVFAGVALDRAGEIEIARAVSRENIVCWTQELTVTPSSGQDLTIGDVIYIVFEGGPPQDAAEIDWDFIPSAEPIGAFTTEADAQALCAARGRIALERHVWRVPIGWYDTRLKP